MDPDIFLKRHELSRKEADEKERKRCHAVAVWRGHEEEQIRWIQSARYKPVSNLYYELRRARFYLQELGEQIPTCTCGEIVWLHVEGPIKCNKCRGRDWRNPKAKHPGNKEQP